MDRMNRMDRMDRIDRKTLPKTVADTSSVNNYEGMLYGNNVIFTELKGITMPELLNIGKKVAAERGEVVAAATAKPSDTDSGDSDDTLRWMNILAGVTDLDASISEYNNFILDVEKRRNMYSRASIGDEDEDGDRSIAMTPREAVWLDRSNLTMPNITMDMIYDIVRQSRTYIDIIQEFGAEVDDLENIQYFYETIPEELQKFDTYKDLVKFCDFLGYVSNSEMMKNAVKGGGLGVPILWSWKSGTFIKKTSDKQSLIPVWIQDGFNFDFSRLRYDISSEELHVYEPYVYIWNRHILRFYESDGLKYSRFCLDFYDYARNIPLFNAYMRAKSPATGFTSPPKFNANLLSNEVIANVSKLTTEIELVGERSSTGSGAALHLVEYYENPNLIQSYVYHYENIHGVTKIHIPRNGDTTTLKAATATATATATPNFASILYMIRTLWQLGYDFSNEIVALVGKMLFDRNMIMKSERASEEREERERSSEERERSSELMAYLRRGEIGLVMKGLLYMSDDHYFNAIENYIEIVDADGYNCRRLAHRITGMHLTNPYTPAGYTLCKNYTSDLTYSCLHSRLVRDLFVSRSDGPDGPILNITLLGIGMMRSSVFASIRSMIESGVTTDASVEMMQFYAICDDLASLGIRYSEFVNFRVFGKSSATHVVINVLGIVFSIRIGDLFKPSETGIKIIVSTTMSTTDVAEGNPSVVASYITMFTGFTIHKKLLSKLRIRNL